MTLDIFIICIAIVFAIVFFLLELLPLEVTALTATTILMIGGVLTPEEAFSGFSNSAVIVIAAIFIISKALVKTGFLEVLAAFIARIGGDNKWITIFIFFVTVSVLSGFLNNTATVAIFIPFAFRICQKFEISPTKVLLPLSYAAIFGGTLTLIGTSTNLVISSILVDNGYEPLGMFEFTKLGLIFLVVGSIYNIILSKWFLPSRSVISSLTRKYHMGTYLTELKVGPNSQLIGSTYPSFSISKKYKLQVLKIIRGETPIRFKMQSTIIKEGDIFLIQINVNDMLKFKDDFKLLLLSDVKMTQNELTGKSHVLVEGLVPENSNLIGHNLYQFNFRSKFSAFVLALKRQRQYLRDKIAKIPIRFSDTLLILVPRDELENLRNDNDIIVLEELDIHLRNEPFWWLSIILLPTIMITATLNIIPIINGVVIGVILLIGFKTISVNEAYNSINSSVIFLLAGLIPFGLAFHKTGADKLIADMMYWIPSNNIFSPEVTPYVMLSFIYLFTFVTSAFISNAAVAVLLTPVGMVLASMLNVDPKPFFMAIAFGSSVSFMTPMGYQTNMMVYGPGQYKMKDFFFSGLPLTLIFWIIASYCIPKIYPF